MVALNENDATEVSTSETEGQMRDLLGKVAKSRKQQAQDGPSANNALPLIAGMAAAPIGEIERLLSELQDSRAFLNDEAQRIERQIARYSQVSAGALDAAKIVTSQMAEWSKARDTSEKAEQATLGVAMETVER